MKSLRTIIDSYDPRAALDHASTIPSTWYTDKGIFELEKLTVFSNSWHVAARVEQLAKPGDYVTTEIADEPIVIVRGSDNQIRAFFNACRHHAAAVMTAPCGNTPQMRCPYHGWTYSLEGELKGTPDFSEVCDFDRANNGLVPVEIATWEQWLFVSINGRQRPAPQKGLESWFGQQLTEEFRALELDMLHWFERQLSHRLQLESFC